MRKAWAVVLLVVGCEAPEPRAQKPVPSPPPVEKTAPKFDVGAPAVTEPPPAVEPSEPAPPPVEEAPQTFAEATEHLHEGRTPTAAASKAAWGHYKAKDHAAAQKEFALASIADEVSWKHPFNFACASAKAGDTAMVKVGLAEAMAREPETVARKARKDGDLASVRDEAWFEEILSGESAEDAPPSPADAARGSMDLLLRSGPTGGGGIARLDASGRWSLVRPDASVLGLDPDGHVYVMAGIENAIIEPLEGGHALRVDPPIGWPNDFAPAGKNTFWVTGGKGVAFHDGTAWSVRPTKESIGKGRAYPNNIIRTPDETIWVTNQTTLYRIDDDAFAPIELPGESPKILDFHVGGDGSVFLRRSDDVLRWADGSWSVVELPFADQSAHIPGTFTTRADGTIAIAGRNAGPLSFVATDGTASSLRLDPPTWVTEIGADAAGRFWVGGQTGVFVIKADLSGVARWYPRGSIDVLQPGQSYGEYGIERFFARGEAVELPKAGKPKGWVRGVFVKDGEPVAGARIELCEDPARGNLGTMESPCEMPRVGEVARYGTTASDGSFLVFDVPPGTTLEFVARMDDHWFVSSNAPCCDDMKAAGIHDIGTVKYRKGRKNRASF